MRNPLDYHTYIWGDPDALTACSRRSWREVDCHLLMLDFPRADRCEVSEFETRLPRSRPRGATPARVPAWWPPSPRDTGGRRRASDRGRHRPDAGDHQLSPAAVVAAQQIGAAQAGVDGIRPLPPLPAAPTGPVTQWDEGHAKAMLASDGLAVPRSVVANSPAEAPSLAVELGFPVVLKALSADLAHKSEIGGVHLGLDSAAAVRRES